MVIQDIDAGKIDLIQGSLVAVPVANPRAYASQKRYIDENLNRVFRETPDAGTYEAGLANQLCALVRESDIMLDIHSSFAPGPVNLFVDYPTPENEAFARALGADFSIYDWPKVYEQNSEGFLSHTTDRYAYESNKIGILYEAGQHNDPMSVQAAYEAILRSLHHFGMVEMALPSNPGHSSIRVYMEKVFGKHADGDAFAASWHHLQMLPTNTLIAVRETGEELRVTEDSVILFPKEYAKPGGEWFYLGVLNKK
jgi:predicted deacylase